MKKQRLLMLMFASLSILFTGCEKKTINSEYPEEPEYYVKYEARFSSNSVISTGIRFTTPEGEMSSKIYKGETFCVTAGPFKKGQNLHIYCPSEQSDPSSYYSKYAAIYVQKDNNPFVIIASTTSTLDCSETIK